MQNTNTKVMYCTCILHIKGELHHFYPTSQVTVEKANLQEAILNYI